MLAPQHTGGLVPAFGKRLAAAAELQAFGGNIERRMTINAYDKVYIRDQ